MSVRKSTHREAVGLEAQVAVDNDVEFKPTIQLHQDVGVEAAADDDSTELLGRRLDADTESKTATASDNNKILFLDGIRGLAAMMVVAAHTFWMHDTPLGEPAVDTFFVLSAFLLTMIVEKKAQRLLRENASAQRYEWALLDYFMRRLLRVYPLFFVVAVTLALLPREQQHRYFLFFDHQQMSLWGVLTFQVDYRFHVFWTLPLEIAYYCLIPAFVAGVILVGKRWMIAFIPLTYWVVSSGLTRYRSHHQPLGPHLPTFVCGSMAAIVYIKADRWITEHQFVFRWYHKILLRIVEYFFLALLLSVQFKGLLFTWVHSNPVPPSSPPGGAPFISVNVAVILVCELLLPGAISKAFEWSVLRYAGKISFSMYLLHSFVVFTPSVFHQSWWDRFFSVWTLCFLVASISYYAIEVPCLALANWLSKKIKERELEANTKKMPLVP